MGIPLVTLEVPGDTPPPSGRFLGLRFTIEADISRAPGSRVISVKVGDAPLDPPKSYSLATNDFMARGGDDYAMFRDIEPVLPVADFADAGVRRDRLCREYWDGKDGGGRIVVR